MEWLKPKSRTVWDNLGQSLGQSQVVRTWDIGQDNPIRVVCPVLCPTSYHPVPIRNEESKLSYIGRSEYVGCHTNSRHASSDRFVSLADLLC